MPGGRTAVKSSVDTNRQTTGNVAFSLTEPNPARFAWKETKAVQRPKSGAAPVSEVRSASANPFETWDKSDALSASLGVRDGKLAEGEIPPANSLGGALRMGMVFGRIAKQTLLSWGFADTTSQPPPRLD